MFVRNVLLMAAMGLSLEALGRDTTMEPALSDLTSATVLRDNGVVRIDDVPLLGFPAKMTTYCGALEAALSVTNHPVAYTDAMAWTGLAFRMRWFVGEEGVWSWCPSAPVGEFPAERRAFGRVSGWQFHPVEFENMDGPPHHAERYADRVVASIDAGLPVVAYDDSWNCAVILGYEDGGNVVLERTYWSGEEPRRLELAKLTPLLEFPEGYETPPSERQQLKTVIETAIAHWQNRGGAARIAVVLRVRRPDLR